jgi:hypothetical protein
MESFHPVAVVIFILNDPVPSVMAAGTVVFIETLEFAPPVSVPL